MTTKTTSTEKTASPARTATKDGPCCPPSELASCCPPEEKSSCCAPGSTGCGCE